MKAFTRLMVVALAALLVPVAATADDDAAALPTYTVGHVWPLADSAFELVRVEDDEYVYAGRNAEIRLTKALGLIAARRGEHYVELITGVALPWPLKPGDWGATSGGWRSSRPGRTFFGGRSMQLTAERLVWHVEGYEDLALTGGKIRALKILYQMLASGIAVREAIEWEIAMWYAPSAGVFVKALDPTFGVLNFELASSVDLPALRRRAALPDPPPAVTSVDSRRRHRDAAGETCGGRKCAVAAPRPATD